ncbi:MAG: hybrid sensor histidine kinase/response regulator [Gammaproteobacteria bacterium]|nr:hybrid sensor histidine kinase/response regulator [Gammaproteobacteria bacterium]
MPPLRSTSGCDAAQRLTAKITHIVPTSSSTDPVTTDVELASTARKVGAGFAVALACLAVVGVVSYLSVVRLNENAAWVAHTQEVITRLESILAAATDSETAERGYVITGDESYLEPYRQSATLVDEQARRLLGLTADNPAQTQRLNSMVPLVTERLAILRAIIELRKSQGFAAAQSEILSGKGKQFHDRIRRLIDEMKGAETALLSEREQRVKRSSAVARGVIIGGGLLGCGLVGFALVAIRRDFAGRALAEQALRDAKNQLEVRVQQRTAQLAKAAEANARLASIIEFSDDAVASKDLDGVITSWNPGAERLFGYSSQEAVGKPMSMLMPPERSSEEPTILGRIARGETTDHFETVRVRKDGARIDVSITISPIRDGRGLIVGASTIARDITERRVAQSKVQAQLARLNLLQHITRAIGERQDIQSIFQVVIRTLEEHLPVDFCCICLYEPAENCVIVTSVGMHSEALARELAMTRQARIEIDQNGLSHCVRGRLVYEPDISCIPFPFAQRLAGGALRAMVAAPLLVESRVFGVLIAARQQSHSFSSGECEFLRQVSEHVALAAHQAHLYSALQQAYDDLRQTQKAVMQQERLLALGQMASGIAHDINNAISPVALYTESLLEREPDLSPRARSHLETIQRAIDDVAQTVARMREFYRQSEPQSTLLPVDMNALVRQIVDLTRARWSDMAQRRGIAIEVQTELASDLPTIMGADNEIREALTNLIFNAVDAMPNGGPLTLRTRVAQDEAARSQESATCGFVQIEVIDAGIGMDENTRGRCLEPFFTTKGERGTGLGLAMVYGTVQRHSANIEIESAVGKGTTMRLSFPIPTTPAATAEMWVSAGAVTPLRVLVVDDDPLVLESLRETLTADGHGVTTADGGQAGIDTFLTARAQGNPFPVVITDLGMPYVDGRTVSSAIKTAAPETIVLLLTGWGQRLVAEGDIPPHVDHVLSKPPKLRALREALAHCLDVRAS